jgi:cytochrome P450
MVRGAIDEFLRYEPPIQTAVPRFALRDVEVDGLTVPDGAIVSAMVGSANRDPARFDDPDRLDLDRPDCQPLSFAPGIHYCLGAAVARLEGEVAIGAVFQRFPRLRLDNDHPPMRPGNPLGQMARGPAELPVST